MPLAAKILLAGLLVLALAWAWILHRARVTEAAAEAAFPPEGRLLSVGGHQVHAVVMGPETGEAPDLVLIHGASGNTRDMTFSLAPRLAETYRVMVFDRPGLGYTDRLGRTGAGIARQAELLVEAAHVLGAEKPIVMGHSYGGAVALAWAVDHPDSIAALVAVSAASHPWDSGLSAYYKVLSHPIYGPVAIPPLTALVSDARVKEAVSGVFAPDPVPNGYLSHFGAGLTLRRGSLRANALQRAGLLEEIKALAPRYPEIDVPTEIVHGAADTTVGLKIHSEPLVQAIPGANLDRLSDTGHMPHHAREDDVVAAIHRAAARAGLRPAP